MLTKTRVMICATALGILLHSGAVSGQDPDCDKCKVESQLSCAEIISRLVVAIAENGEGYHKTKRSPTFEVHAILPATGDEHKRMFGEPLGGFDWDIYRERLEKKGAHHVSGEDFGVDGLEEKLKEMSQKNISYFVIIAHNDGGDLVFNDNSKLSIHKLVQKSSEYDLVPIIVSCNSTKHYFAAVEEMQANSGLESPGAITIDRRIYPDDAEAILDSVQRAMSSHQSISIEDLQHHVNMELTGRYGADVNVQLVPEKSQRIIKDTTKGAGVVVVFGGLLITLERGEEIVAYFSEE